MRSHSIAFAFACLPWFMLATGCSTVRTVTLSQEKDRTIHEQPEAFSSMEKFAENEKAYIRFAYGEPVNKVKLRITPDSLIWATEQPGSWSEIDRWSEANFYYGAPWSEITSITFVSPGRGALEGLGIGLLVGGLLGALMGFADGDDPEGSFIWVSAETKAVVGGGFFGAIGGLIGIIIGAARGHQYVYLFDNLDERTLGCVGSPFVPAHRLQPFQSDRRSVSLARPRFYAIILSF